VLMWLVRRVWPEPEAAPDRPRTRRRPRPRFGSVISGLKCGRLLVYCPERIRRTRPAVAMKWPDRTAQVRQLPELGNPSRGTRPERATEMRQSKSRHNVSSSTRDGATDSAAPSGRTPKTKQPRPKGLGCSLGPFHGHVLSTFSTPLHTVLPRSVR
jgi:hypothetical protein